MGSENRIFIQDDWRLAAARKGDVSAVWELAEALRPYLKAVVSELLGDRLIGKVDASDVVQQSFLAAVRRFPQFQGSTAAEWQAWLVAIARTEVRNQLRYWHRQRRDVSREQRPLTGSSSGKRQLANDDSSPSEHAMRLERAAGVMAAIDRLRPDDRQVICLRHFERLPYAEIAARMGRTEVAVCHLWSRALARLRKQLGAVS